MTPAVETALSQRFVTLAGLIRIALPGHTITLCDGSASIVFNGETYTGRDALYGVIGEVETIAEATGDTIPGMEMTLLPPSLEAAIALCQPVNEDADVRMWLAVVDADTGLVVPDPELMFPGEIDTLTLVQDRGELSVEISVASVWERLFEPDEGARLSDAFHQGIWPGELGFANMTGTNITKLWGPGDKQPTIEKVPQVSRGGANRYL